MFARRIKIAALVLVLVTVAFVVIYQYHPNEVVLSTAITLGTVSYHFLMRLAVGYVINGLYHNQFDYRKKWFQERRFEKRLYEALKVKKWKDKMPTFAPEMLDLHVHTWEEVAGAMCQSEIVHFTIVVLGFAPIFASLLYGAFWVFFITSVLSAGVEMIFVIMQRYNRPRVVKMIERERLSPKRKRKSAFPDLEEAVSNGEA